MNTRRSCQHPAQRAKPSFRHPHPADNGADRNIWIRSRVERRFDEQQNPASRNRAHARRLRLEARRVRWRTCDAAKTTAVRSAS
jgi:hypothetical protein